MFLNGASAEKIAAVGYRSKEMQEGGRKERGAGGGEKKKHKSSGGGRDTRTARAWWREDRQRWLPQKKRRAHRTPRQHVETSVSWSESANRIAVLLYRESNSVPISENSQDIFHEPDGSSDYRMLRPRPSCERPFCSASWAQCIMVASDATLATDACFTNLYCYNSGIFHEFFWKKKCLQSILSKSISFPYVRVTRYRDALRI